MINVVYNLFVSALIHIVILGLFENIIFYKIVVPKIINNIYTNIEKMDPIYTSQTNQKRLNNMNLFIKKRKKYEDKYVNTSVLGTISFSSMIIITLFALILLCYYVIPPFFGKVIYLNLDTKKILWSNYISLLLIGIFEIFFMLVIAFNMKHNDNKYLLKLLDEYEKESSELDTLYKNILTGELLR